MGRGKSGLNPKQSNQKNRTSEDWKALFASMSARTTPAETAEARALFEGMSAASERQRAFAESIINQQTGGDPRVTYSIPKAIKFLKAIRNGDFDYQIGEKLKEPIFSRMPSDRARDFAIDAFLRSHGVYREVAMIANRKNAGKIIDASKGNGVPYGKSVYRMYIESLD